MGKHSKRTKSNLVAHKMKAEQKINPFEVRMNKQKRDVLGRKRKLDRGLPGIARNKAVKKRQVTILQEYLSKNKNNKFVDRRIGEKVPNLNKEDKMMARFSREIKKRFKKSSIYNLNEDEELTHLNRKLDEIDKFDNPGSESDEEGKLDSEFVRNVNFGGFDEEAAEFKKTHKERLEEIISESKRKKYEKKSENEANMDLTEKLDKDWKNIANLLNKSKKVESSSTNKSIDDYDLKVRELKFEAKGYASDRLKSAEEVAAEESEKLRKLEEERIKRMRGDDSAISKRTNSKHISADDLCDGFAFDESSLTDENNQERETNSEVEEEENVEVQSDNDSDDSDRYSDVLLDEGDFEDKENSLEPVSAAPDKLLINKKDLPFVFTVPSSESEFVKMMSGHTAEEQAIIVDRIIKCNHPSLGANNKKKLETFFVILFKYLYRSSCESKLELKILDLFTPHFTALLRFSKKPISESLRNIIKEYQEKFQKDIKASSLKSYPDLGILYLFKVIQILYPTSDFQHPVVTPAMIFMSQLLTRYHLNSFCDVACCIFLCETFYNYVSFSKRFVPEAVRCLYHLLCSVTKDYFPNQNCNSEKIPQYHTVRDESFEKLDLFQIIYSKEVKLNERTGIAALSHILCVITKFAKLYEELPSFTEIFSPFLETIEKLQVEAFSDLKNEFHALISLLKKPLAKSVLALESKKPKSLKQYEPKFETVFTGRKERVGSQKKLERQKLVHKYKREMKGAVREIRRDNRFLATQELREQMQKDEERKRKVKELYAELAQQEGDFKRLKKKSKLVSL